MHVGDGMPKLFDIIWNMLENTYTEKVNRHPERYERWLTIRETTKELLQSWLFRLRQIHIKPLAIVRLSMVLLHHQCNGFIWSVLSHLRIVLSVNTTKKMYAIANQVLFPVRVQWNDHSGIAVVGKMCVLLFVYWF